MNETISVLNDVINYIKNEIQAGRRYVAIDKSIADEFLVSSPIVNRAKEDGLTVPQNTSPAQNVIPTPQTNTQPHPSTTSLYPEIGKYKKYRGTAVAPLVAFIGYEPSFDSDANDKAFSGEQGELLDKIITVMGLTEKEYVIVNIFEEAARNFTGPAIEKQVDHFKDFINQVSPRVCIIMGDEASRLLLKTKSPVANIHGIKYPLFGFPSIPTYHPQTLLRFKNLKRSAWEDFKAALAIIGRQPPKITKK